GFVERLDEVARFHIVRLSQELTGLNERENRIGVNQVARNVAPQRRRRRLEATSGIDLADDPVAGSPQRLFDLLTVLKRGAQTSHHLCRVEGVGYAIRRWKRPVGQLYR